MKVSTVRAVVTGAASGLGEACARAIVAGGGRAMILDQNRRDGMALADELGDRAGFRETDVTDEVSVTEALDAADTSFGTLNVVINCAGIAAAAKTLGRDGPHDLGLFRRIVDVNLVGTFNLCRLGAERMQKNDTEDGEKGVIVNTASIAAFDGQKGQPAYAASKAGVAGMTLPMARDLASYGVRVNCIAPGLFLTPMLAGLPEEAREALAQQPLFPKRLGDPAEIADLACFMIECRYMNGETVRLDAGTRLP